MFAKLNALGAEGKPFLCIIDYKATKVIATPLDELKKHDIEFDLFSKNRPHSHKLSHKAESFETYKAKFDLTQEEIKKGNSYLLNLTTSTPIECDLDLRQIFDVANAPYKLRYKDEFVCFSPESFITIEDNTISTFPMKGTIKASLENAKELLLNDPKELAEHTMVVDLLRNDLSMVASGVRVEAFRSISKAGDLLQTSSHISGTLELEWRSNIGSILQKLLPAGSISGTPKRKTLGIIDRIEGYDRGFYSGIFGVFDGKSFQSAVMIRFIEKVGNKTDGRLVYKSGGGITLDSDAFSEYNEMMDKIYI